MKKQIEIVLPPGQENDNTAIYTASAKKLNLNLAEITAVIPRKRSLDARSYSPLFRLLCDVYVNEFPVKEKIAIDYKPVKSDKKVIIVGFGPGGMFASLRLLEMGIKPVVIERGNDVQTRRKDLRAIQQLHKVNPDSNYCFGEGGAGAYSDGKLYTRATKRGNIKKILNILVQHGANPDILIDSHPHIGSNKLPKVVKSIRGTIINCGGEIHFNSRVTDFIFKEGKALGVIVNDDEEFTGDAVILATGHSARDIYYLLNNKKVKLEPKAFAMGVRIEHPQPIINEIQYHNKEKNENLPAASYSISCHFSGRGIYSFCMCPGGIIIPAATAPGEIVVNGMSLSYRNSPFANSGLVVTIDENDWKQYESNYPFGGLTFQQELEKLAFELANNTQSAPAQRATDFVRGKTSGTLPASSYIPGLTSAPLHEVLPEFIVDNLKESISFFGKRMKGFYTDDALLVAIESRTSTPVRIPRLKETYMHPEVEGFFPCGEGAGYAGGIVSAAIDGENCADAAAKYTSGLL